MTICRDLTLVKHLGHYATAEPLKCRSWGCDYCAPDRRRQLIAMAIGGRPNTFITLTVNPRFGTSPAHRARMLVVAWRTVRRWASSEHAQIDPIALEAWRAHPSWRSRSCRPKDILGYEHPDNGTLPFLAVFEATKLGEPHLHILCRSEWIPQAWLSRCMKSLNGAFVVGIERIDDAGKMAGYVAKYCGKEPARFDTVKRYWSSQDYELDPPEDACDDPEDGATYEVVRKSPYVWAQDMRLAGWQVAQTKTGWAANDVWRAATGPPDPTRLRLTANTPP